MLIGIDYVPQALETDTTETAKNDQDGSSTVNMRSKNQVDFENLTTIYVGANLTENMYLKAGITKVDIRTNENLGTGSIQGY